MSCWSDARGALVSPTWTARQPSWTPRSAPWPSRATPRTSRTCSRPARPAAPPAARVVPPPTGGAAVEAARPALRFRPRTFGRRLKAASFCSNPDDGTQCAIDPLSCQFATSPHYTPTGAAFEKAVKAQLRVDIVHNVHAIVDEVYACVRSGRHADLGLLKRFVEPTVLSGPGPAACAAHAPNPLSPAAAYEASIEAQDFAPALAALALRVW